MIELYLFGERQEKHLMRELSVSNVFSLKDYYTKIARTVNIWNVSISIIVILNIQIGALNLHRSLHGSRGGEEQYILDSLYI